MNHPAQKFSLVPMFSYTSALVLFLALPFAGAFADPPQAPGRVVNCDRGGRLAIAVRNARPGDTIRFTGTCREQVTITTDRLTLDGQGEGIIDGSGVTCPELKSGTVTELEAIVGLVEIDTAQGVTLERLTVQNSQCDGIFLRGSSATLRAVTVQNSTDDGIDSEQAGITLEGSILPRIPTLLTNNGENGMNLSNNSTANIFKGTVSFSDNPRFGVLNHHSLLFVSSGAELDVHKNMQTGIGVFGGGELMGYTDSKMTVYDNSVQGLLLINGGMFASYTEVNILNNGDGSLPEDAGSAGIALVDGSVFTQTGGKLTIANGSNDSVKTPAIGMAADNSTVALRMTAADQEFLISSLSLTFGTRATLTGTILYTFSDCNNVLMRPSRYDICVPSSSTQH